jgi:hypothetical protein
LINALDNGNYDVANYLLDQGANPNIWDMHGRTPLFCAVDRKSTPPPKSILSGVGGGLTSPAAPETGGRVRVPGAAAASAAAGAGAVPAVRPMAVINRLLKMGVDVNHQLTRKRPYGNGRDRFTDYDMRGGVGPLFLATMYYDHETMEALIKHGAEVDLVNVFQMTPLMYTVGMSGTAPPSPMSDAQTANAIKSVEILLNAGANINAQIRHSRTHTAVVMSFIASRDLEGRTALMGAADDGSAKIVQYLIDHGADLTAKDATNRTALDLSREPCPGPGLKGNQQQKQACERLMTGRAATETVLVAAMMKAGLHVATGGATN